MISLTQFYHKTQDFIFGPKTSTDIFDTKTQVVTSTSSRKCVYNSILSHPLESYFRAAVKLLIWEQPYLSAFAFVTLNICYWLIVTWNRRFISILSIVWLFLILCKTFHDFCGPVFIVSSTEKDTDESCNISEMYSAVHEMLTKTRILLKDMWKLRKENRGLFCSLMCGFFSFLAFIGKVFPGVLIAYTLVLVLTLGPGIVLHLIPETLYEQFHGFFNDADHRASPATTGTSDSDKDLDEFVPEISPETLRQLSINKDDSPEFQSLGAWLTAEPLSLESSLPELIDDSCPNDSDFSLYQGLGAFPSVEEESSEDTSDRVPIPSATEMHFDPTHFKDESSGSESDHFTVEMTVKHTTDTKKTSEIQLHSLSDDELADFEILDNSDIPT